ncbi:PQQ-binding-like beta-propeller repeat protein [Sinosporangium album]|uniref:outer membrane protein assembly factor BamB family protein n=1 Tax=Sinosporangium album TaxID=504805 RepID=UPI0015A27342|nr:PQQ-binding-like beta-propeller repeat protein [Sinosporangium album]
MAWRADTGAAVLSTPVLVDDMLYAVDVRGVVHAFDAADGTSQWRSDGVDAEWDQLDPLITTALAVWGDLLFLPDQEYEGCVFVHDRSTGELLHRLEGGAGCCTIVGDILLLTDVSDGVRALDLPGLTLRWHNETRTGLLEAGPAISESGVAFAALGFEGHHTHSGVVAFDVSSGTEVFQVGDDQGGRCPVETEVLSPEEDDFDDEGPSDWVLFGQAHPVVAEGLVWMPVRREHHDDGFHPAPYISAEVVGLDPATGQRRWLFQLDPGLWSEVYGAVAVADGSVFFTALQGGDPEVQEQPAGDVMLYAVDIATARPAWTARLPGSPVGSPVLSGGLLYVAMRNGTVATYHAATGELAWSLDIDEKIVGSQYELGAEHYGEDYEEESLAVLPADGTVYVRTRAGIFALR